MSRPLTRKEWLAFLEKACDEFDWESAGQKREWVGLTQQDIDIAFDDTQEGGGFNEFARAIEQILRRKNT
jgi:hypothetical protein